MFSDWFREIFGVAFAMVIYSTTGRFGASLRTSNPIAKPPALLFLS
jgi:hypothetical protein